MEQKSYFETKTNPENQIDDYRFIEIKLETLKILKEGLSGKNPVFCEQWQKFQFEDSVYDGSGELVIAKDKSVEQCVITKLFDKLEQNPKALFFHYRNEKYIPIFNVFLRKRPEHYKQYATQKITDEIAKLFILGKKDLPKLQNTAQNNVVSLIQELSQEEDFKELFSPDLRQYLLDLVDDFLKEEDSVALVASLNRLYDLDNGNTFEHSLKVFTIGYNFAKELGFQGEELKMISQVLLLHDIGKSFIPTEILLKNEKLTDEEFAIIKLHPCVTFEILSNRQKVLDILSIASALHHEKENPNHYKSYGPFTTHQYLLKDGVLEKVQEERKNPLLIATHRIVHIADVFEALTSSKRGYKNKFSILEALNTMEQERKEGFYHVAYFENFKKMILQKYALRIVKHKTLSILQEMKAIGLIHSQNSSQEVYTKLNTKINAGLEKACPEKKYKLELINIFVKDTLPKILKSVFATNSMNEVCNKS